MFNRSFNVLKGLLCDDFALVRGLFVTDSTQFCQPAFDILKEDIYTVLPFFPGK
jgi:hypothetical protein